jgi:quinol monooxygenase YgiN
MEEIKGIARVKFRPGKLDDWKGLTEQAMEIVRTRDPGTLQYEVFFNEDDSEAIVFERYRDADAALAHFANISHLMEPLMATATVTGEVLGTPNETMRAQLGDGEPKLFTPWMAAPWLSPRSSPFRSAPGQHAWPTAFPANDRPSRQAHLQHAAARGYGTTASDCQGTSCQ